MQNITIDIQNSDTWKIQLTINFIYSKDTEEELVMHSISENVQFTCYNDANEVANELFEWFCSRYQGNLETSMKGSEFFLIQFNLCITNVIK